MSEGSCGSKRPHVLGDLGEDAGMERIPADTCRTSALSGRGMGKDAAHEVYLPRQKTISCQICQRFSQEIIKSTFLASF